jgi:hypothetical protein
VEFPVFRGHAVKWIIARASKIVVLTPNAMPPRTARTASPHALVFYRNSTARPGAEASRATIYLSNEERLKRTPGMQPPCGEPLSQRQH